MGLGANVAGAWGAPVETIICALKKLEEESQDEFFASSLYRTPPVGPANQPDFVNAVCVLSTTLSPTGLLALVKSIERAAGRGRGRRWGPRPLDIDILDYKGRVHHWPGVNFSGPRRRLVLPHPEVHKRAFMLKPLAEVAPNWRHPVLGTSVQQLLRRLHRDADKVVPMDDADGPID